MIRPCTCGAANINMLLHACMHLTWLPVGLHERRPNICHGCPALLSQRLDRTELLGRCGGHAPQEELSTARSSADLPQASSQHHVGCDISISAAVALKMRETVRYDRLAAHDQLSNAFERVSITDGLVTDTSAKLSMRLPAQYPSQTDSGPRD